MVLPFMTIYLTGIGFSLFQAGIVVGMFGAGAICGGYIGGKLTDKIGFYRIQLITLIGGGCLFILLGLMKSYPLICLFTFILSLVNEAFRPANNTAIAHLQQTGKQNPFLFPEPAGHKSGLGNWRNPRWIHRFI